MKNERAPRTSHADAAKKDIASIIAQGRGRYFMGEGNLYLNVSKGGTASWTFFYRFGGKQYEMGLGSTRHVPYRIAVKKATDANWKLRCEGVNPKVKKVRVLTLRQLLERHITKMRSEWKKNEACAENGKKAGSETAWRGSVAKHAATIIDLPVNEITKEQVEALLTPIWGRPTAYLLQERLEKLLSAAKDDGMVSENVARWKGCMEHRLAPKKKGAGKNRASLPADETVALVAQLGGYRPTINRLLTFIILTAVRADEAREAVWSEFDLGKAEWTIPAERMKGKKEFVVPLSKQALALLKALPRKPGVDNVFEREEGGLFSVNAALDRLCEPLSKNDPEKGGLGFDGRATVHGFRATFSTWANANLSNTFESALIDASIAHAKPGVEGAYNRGPLLAKRAALMQVWANYLHGIKAEVILKLVA